MTAFAYEQQAASTSVIAQLVMCVDDLAALVAGGCLVEDAHGRVVAQRLTGASVPSAALSAVLDGTASALRGALTRPRTTALLPSGPVVEGALRDGGERVALIGLEGGGSVWLLPGDAQPLDLDRALLTLRRADELLQCDGDTSEEVVAWLDGDVPPPAGLGAGPWRLARVDAPGESQAALLRRAATGLAVAHRGTAYVVLRGRETLDVAQARVAITEPGTDLAAARRQVDAALPFVPLGCVRSVREVRAAAVLQHLGASLATLPDLGQDPLDQLLEHDARRGTCFADALAAWLDAGCDVMRATEHLGWHGNTMRYRLRRAFDLLGTDFRDDPDGRLAVHVRLRSEAGRRT